jgi:DNA-binding NarL/FixJ family response regulator
MRILIVDDHAGVRRLVRSVIADLATQIDECSNSADALMLFANHRPDWVLMDINMPGGDGLETTRVITAFWPRMRICIVTGYDLAELREAAFRAGACGYVLKEDLLSLRTILRGSAEAPARERESPGGDPERRQGGSS